MPDTLPGWARLVDTCQRLGLNTYLWPPGRHPPAPGALIGGHPLDAELASLYTHVGAAALATDVGGLVLARVDDTVNELQSDNAWWQGSWQQQLAAPLFVFGGESGLAYYYATVPELADKLGHQPVVWVNGNAEAHALPVASSVDHFLDTYSRYLEALLAHPDHAELGSAALGFPWDVPLLLTRDVRLVALLHEGRFNTLMPQSEEARLWVSRVLSPPSAR